MLWWLRFVELYYFKLRFLSIGKMSPENLCLLREHIQVGKYRARFVSSDFDFCTWLILAPCIPFWLPFVFAHFPILGLYCSFPVPIHKIKSLMSFSAQPAALSPKIILEVSDIFDFLLSSFIRATVVKWFHACAFITTLFFIFCKSAGMSLFYIKKTHSVWNNNAWCRAILR